MTLDDATHRAGSARFSTVIEVHRYLAGFVLPVVNEIYDASPTIDREIPAALLARAVEWCASITRLHEPADVQAVTAATRTLYEMAVDLTLLRADPYNAAEKVRAWEESAKLKEIDRIAGFYAKRRRSPPVERVIAQAQDAELRERVQRDRDRFWPSKKSGKGLHPSRWTGNDLLTDAIAADEATPIELENTIPSHSFESFYVTSHANACWSLHGSGTLAVRRPAAERIQDCVTALSDCAVFAAQIGQLALHSFGLWGPATAVQMHQALGRLYASVLSEDEP